MKSLVFVIIYFIFYFLMVYYYQIANGGIYMTYYIIGTIFYTFFGVFFYCKKYLKEHSFSIKTFFYFIFICLNMLFIILLPIIYDRLFSLFLLAVSLLGIFVKPSKSTNKMDGVILLKSILFAYYFFYLPYLVFYMYRFEEVKMMYVKSISLILLVYLATFLFGYNRNLVSKLDESKKTIKKVIRYGSNIFIFVVFFGIILSLLKDDQKLLKFDFIYDYTYEPIFQVEDNTIDGDVYDFSYDDTYVYYILRDNANDTYQFRLYNHQTDTLEYEKTIHEGTRPDYQADYQYFIKFDNQVYIFLDDGIYLYKDKMMYRTSSIDGTKTQKFIMDDKLYIYNEEMNMMYTSDKIDCLNK